MKRCRLIYFSAECITGNCARQKVLTQEQILMKNSLKRCFKVTHPTGIHLGVLNMLMVSVPLPLARFSRT